MAGPAGTAADKDGNAVSAPILPSCECLDRLSRRKVSTGDGEGAQSGRAHFMPARLEPLTYIELHLRHPRSRQTR